MHQNQTNVVADATDIENFFKGGTYISSFIQDDMEHLKSLLDFISKYFQTESLAITCKSLWSQSFIVCSVIPKNVWILDS